MKTIWKYKLKLQHEVIVQLPDGAEILHAGMQDGNICLWAMTNTNVPEEEHLFKIFATGEPMEDNPVKYIGTVLINSYVFHVFYYGIIKNDYKL